MTAMINKKANDTKFLDGGVVWAVFGHLFATVLYTIVKNCSSLYPVLYPEVCSCLFSSAHWRRLALHLDTNKPFMYFLLGTEKYIEFELK